MKIVIAGAGSVGYHLAKLIALENQDITLIDDDEDVLDQVATKLDVMVIKGDATSMNVLAEAEVSKANLFIAVSTSSPIRDTGAKLSHRSKFRGVLPLGGLSNCLDRHHDWLHYCRLHLVAPNSDLALFQSSLCRSLRRIDRWRNQIHSDTWFLPKTLT